MAQTIEKNAISLLSKFQGCLVGAVAGDCLGSVFESLWAHSISIDKITKLVNKVETAAASQVDKEEDDPEAINVITQWTYTDDTAMARSVARVLVENKRFDVKKMARSFTEEYFECPFRGYGMAVRTVFRELKDMDYLDPFYPAKHLFDGQGSYGNGGAMRICPAALFTFKINDTSKLRKLTEDITKITHSHYQAIQGAVLQAYAVDLALRSNGEVNVDRYLNTLTEQMKLLEEETKSKTSPDGEKLPQFPYCRKLEKIREFVKRKEPTTADEINQELGTDISALESVPAAVFAFLYSTRDIPGLKERNPLEKTIMYAISLGGDSDTIATMAGAIAGACYGIENIPESWLKCCEGTEDALDYAKGLHALQTCDQSSETAFHTSEDSCHSDVTLASQTEETNQDFSMASQTVDENDVQMNSQTEKLDN